MVPFSISIHNEFKFKLDYETSPQTAELLTKVVDKYRTTNYLPPNVSVSLVLREKRLANIVVPIIDDVVNWCRTTIGITSFSITSTDHQLWEEYGGKGNWVLVEINIPDSLVSQSYHLVHYVSDKIFHVDSLLETALFPSKTYETYRNILLTKKKKLSQDEEMRFIGNRQDVNLIFDCSITEITFGPSFPAYSLEQLVTHIANHCTANNIKITKL